MGLLKGIGDDKGASAREAHQGGATIHVPGFAAIKSGNWATLIEEIEAEGWSLEHWAIDHQGAARPVFRRRNL